jgi:hypothetical protein
MYEFIEKVQIYKNLLNSSDNYIAEENLGFRVRPNVKQISPFCTTAV